MTRRLLLALAAPLLGLLTVCTPGTPTCDAPNTTCSTTVCADLNTDPNHCGRCDISCAAGQVCVQGQCSCSGSGKVCGGVCVNTANDPSHCGECGKACAAGEFCVSGSCGPLGPPVQALCGNSGELVSLSEDLVPQPARTVIGAYPQSLASFGGRLYVADGGDNVLYNVDATAVPARKVEGGDRLDKVANQILVRGNRAYVVASGDNLIQVLDLSQTPPGTVAKDRTLDEIPTALVPPAQNTNPVFAAFAGDKLYVTLLGNCMDPTTTAGNRVLELDVSTVPGKVTRELVLNAADYEKDADEPANAPRPAGLAAVGSKLFVAVGNLKPSCYGADGPSAGPGYLAVVDTAAATLSARPIKLPAGCRNPGYVLATATRVYVTCSGAYGSAAAAEEALVVLDAATEAVLKTTTFPRCATSGEVGPNACKTAAPGRMAIRGERLLIADGNAGRLLVTDLEGNVPAAFASGVDLCPLKCFDPAQVCYQSTTDVLALP